MKSERMSAAPPEEWKAEKAKDRRPQWWIFAANVVTLIAAIAYACITRKMWIEMQVQTAIQGKAAKNAERAWVGLERGPEVEVTSLSPNNFQAVIKLAGKNFGKGPALKVISDTRIVTLNVDNNIQSSCNLIFPFVGLKPRWPAVSSDENVFKRQWGQVVFPNQVFSTVANYSGGNVVDVAGKEAYVIGCIVYKDQFSDPHWTKFCYNTGDFAAQVVQDASSFKHLYACNTNNYTDEAESK